MKKAQIPSMNGLIVVCSWRTWYWMLDVGNSIFSEGTDNIIEIGIRIANNN